MAEMLLQEWADTHSKDRSQKETQSERTALEQDNEIVFLKVSALGV